jgi:Tol biopolymer transport system component
MRPKQILTRAALSIFSRFGMTPPVSRRSVVYAWWPDGRVLPVSPQDGFFYQPCIHPDGTCVAFHGNTRGPLRVWCTKFDSLNTYPLTHETSTAIHPSYSWDGTQLVFASDRAWNVPPLEVESLPESFDDDTLSARFDIYVSTAAGDNVNRLTTAESADRRPSFSPDGKSVAFVSDRHGVTDIWLQRVDQGESSAHPIGISEKGWSPRRPWFSADGEWIYFYGQRLNSPEHRICRAAASGSDIAPLPNDTSGCSHGPFVDPGGRTLLMHSRTNGPFTIWELPLDGGEAKPIPPPGVTRALHPTRSRNGVIAFDVPSLNTQWASLFTRR